MFTPETMNLIVAVVLGLHVAVELVHYFIGFVDNRRTKKILTSIEAILKKEPPCVERLKQIERTLKEAR